MHCVGCEDRVAMEGKEGVAVAAARAKEAFASWSGMTVKSRAAVMFRFHALLEKHADELVRSLSALKRKRGREIGIGKYRQTDMDVQPFNQILTRAIDPSINQSINRPINQLSIDELIYQSINHPIAPVDQPIDLPITAPCVCPLNSRRE